MILRKAAPLVDRDRYRKAGKVPSWAPHYRSARDAAFLLRCPSGGARETQTMSLSTSSTDDPRRLDAAPVVHPNSIEGARIGRQQRKHAVMQRTGFRCTYCRRDFLADFESYSTAGIDHFIPRAAGGTGLRRNKKACCYLCNQLKRNDEFTTVREARQLIARRRLSLAIQHAILIAKGRLKALPAPAVCEVKPAA